ncbi:MAG: IS1634 family transposase [Culicoidibacterales bacterium]
MRLKVSHSKNAASLYVIKSVYENKKRTTKVVEKLGTYADIQQRLHGEDPIAWAKDYIKALNDKEKQGKQEVIVRLSSYKNIQHDQTRCFNAGYLFLQHIYFQLGLNKICADISVQHKFSYDLNAILSSLLYGRILSPSSKLSTVQYAKTLLEPQDLNIQQVYRALTVLNKSSDVIQAAIYKNSLSIEKCNTSVLYYDCTNYFFEIEQESGLKQYGISKENRPNPIVQMGLFMDADGIPLAFSINKGNTNEQVTLKPLEQKIISDFGCANFIVCTDAGLASHGNSVFNNIKNRGFITTQSVKKLKGFLRQWVLSRSNWKLALDDSKTYCLDDIDDQAYQDAIFYKERWINENGLEQRLIVTYSPKYRNYQQTIRQNQIDRAAKKLENNPKSIGKSRPNDFKRFITKTSITEDGEAACKEHYTLNEAQIAHEQQYDGIYAVCTNVESTVAEIISLNKKRWEVEECFRIMKSDFKARPVFLSRDDRIEAHFMTCYLSLVLYRFLEKKLNYRFTCTEILATLRDMNLLKVKSDGYIPTYVRTELTDALHEAFDFRTDYEINSIAHIRKIIKKVKKSKF